MERSNLVVLLLGVLPLLYGDGVHGGNVRRFTRSSRNEYRMCVPEDLIEYCKEMAGQETKSTAKIVCISARDRLECLDKIQRREADFGTVDPEDMYVASNIPGEDFAVFEEIRTLEEPNAEYRYEAVAVIHNDLKLDSIADIKGLNSCHTGVGRNVGYKVPLTKLKNMGIIGPLNEADLSPRENELKAFSTLFSKACIVGDWSPDPIIDGKLKDKYSNLCALCEHPNKCNYPDEYSGYVGALKCLLHNGGQIAWTKVIYVRKFFGLPVGTTPAAAVPQDPSQYSYLCPDATRVPVTSPQPCRWAARPWQGYMGNADVVKTADDLRRKIENLSAAGAREGAVWREKVLELNDKTLPKESKLIGPKDYLDKANYTDVIERDYGPPYKALRFCVVTPDEESKCRKLAQAAFSRNVRPHFDCILEDTLTDCLESIRDNGADIITVDAGVAETASRDYNLRPIVAERYPNTTDGSYYAVAVVRKSSPYHSFSELRGAKSCHTGIGRTAGYNAPLYTLLRLGLVDKSACPGPKALSSFFEAGSCLPGSGDSKWGLQKDLVGRLCKLCAGDLEKGDAGSKCRFDASESYSGYTGAFRCLVEGGGDVAFVKHVTVLGNTDGKLNESWALGLKSSDFELLCPDGGRAPVTDYEKCKLLTAPPHMVITSNAKGDSEIDEIKKGLLSASELFSKRPDWFKMFGSFNGKKDLLFKDSAIGLVSINDKSDLDIQYSTVLNTIKECK